MKRNVGSVLLSMVLFAAIAGTAVANGLISVRATPYRFSSAATKSTVDVILSNPHPGSLGGTLTLYVVRANGVTNAVTRSISIPAGNSSLRVVIPYEISDVRYARVTNLEV